MADHWEHMIVEMDNRDRDEINLSRLDSLGEEGWELVAVTRAFHESTAYFKRRAALQEAGK